MKVIAVDYFFGEENMWVVGDVKDVTENRAKDLLEAGLVNVFTEKNGETEAVKTVEVSPTFDINKRETKPLKRKLEKK